MLMFCRVFRAKESIFIIMKFQVQSCKWDDIIYNILVIKHCQLYASLLPDMDCELVGHNNHTIIY